MPSIQRHIVFDIRRLQKNKREAACVYNRHFAVAVRAQVAHGCTPEQMIYALANLSAALKEYVTSCWENILFVAPREIDWAVAAVGWAHINSRHAIYVDQHLDPRAVCQALMRELERVLCPDNPIVIDCVRAQTVDYDRAEICLEYDEIQTKLDKCAIILEKYGPQVGLPLATSAGRRL